MLRNVFSARPERRELKKDKDIENGEVGFKETSTFKKKKKDKKTSHRYAGAAQVECFSKLKTYLRSGY
jgi:hypothetical protein